MFPDLMGSLGDLEGLRLLELGCGRGEFAAFLASRGARVVGLDLSRDLTAASRELADVHGVACQFLQADMVRLPFGDGVFDAAVGVAVLHHLSEPDARRAIEEAIRVVHAGGKVLFCEPVENSRLFDLCQNLIPVGRRGNPSYRPSILSRKAWKEYLRTLDDRPMTTREFVVAGGSGTMVTVSPYGLTRRLARLPVGRRWVRFLERADRFLFRVLPPARYLSQMVLVEYRR
jgi:SAM-dependent methyltransferase